MRQPFRLGIACLMITGWMVPSLTSRAQQPADTPSKQDRTPPDIEALIDRLVEATHVRGTSEADMDPHYLQLALRGFEAVPTLIAHLDDARPTKAGVPAFNNFEAYQFCVGDVVSDLLEGLAGKSLGRDWIRARQGEAVSKAAAAAWWDEARKVGEEAYLIRHVLGEAADTQWPNIVMLVLITKKYPHRLPAVYRSMLEGRPEMVGWPVARAVAASSLPREAKLELFRAAAKNRNQENRRKALWEMRDLDAGQADRLLAECLDALPATPAGPYGGSCPEASFALLARKTSDKAVWEALGRAARRADPGLRVEQLNWLVSEREGESTRKQRLAFLVGFLEDTAVRDVKSDPKRYEGPYSGWDFPRLEVRNFAAMGLARILGLEVEPQANWTAARWAGLRSQVQRAAERELRR